METEKYLKHALFAVSACVSMCVFAADPADGTLWNVRAGVGTSPVNPANWLDGGNWIGGAAPNAKDAVADFRQVGAGDNIWIQIPDGQTATVGAIYFWRGTREIHIIGGGTLALSSSGLSTIHQYEGTLGGNERRLVIHATIETANTPDLFIADIRGPFVCGSGISSRYATYFYPQYYAESSSPNHPLLTADNSDLSLFQFIDAQKFVTAVSPGATGSWQFTDGSRILHRTDGMSGLSLVAGQLLHADGFVKTGAFVKRIYSDDYIEMSETALATGSSTVTFDAFTPNYSQNFGAINIMQETGGINATRTASEQTYVFDIDKLKGESGCTGGFSAFFDGFDVGSSSSSVDNIPGPATLRVHDLTEYPRNCRLMFRASHWSFAGTETQKSMVLPGFKFYHPGSDDKNCQGWMTVEDGVDLTVDTVDGWGGLVIKDGPGSMTVTSPLSTHGKLRVSEGSFVLASTSDVPTMAEMELRGGSFVLAEGAALKPLNLTVKTGAVLEVSEGLDLSGAVTLQAGAIIRIPKDFELDMTGIAVPDGVIFDGPGVVRGLANPKTVVLTNGCAVAVTGSADNINLGALPEGLPTRVQPAVWFSVKDKDSVGYKSGTTTSEVETWYDCRGKGDEYIHASVTGTVYPKVKNGAITISRKQEGTVTLATVGALKWSQPVSGIRAVFQLTRSDQSQAGFLLGTSSGTHPFKRASNTYYASRFDNAASTLVRNAPYYINGRVVDSTVAWNEKSGAEGAWQTYAMPFQTAYKTLQLVESHPLSPGVSSDCIGWQGDAYNGYSVGEVLVYTNELTEIERKQVENYVLKKWFGVGLHDETVIPENQHFETVSAGSGLAVATGDLIVADGIAGTGSFGKKGAGGLVFQTLNNENADLIVSDGSVTIKGNSIDISSLTNGAALHLDATDDASFPDAKDGDNFPYDGAEEGAQLVASWLDVVGRNRSARQPNSSTKLPTRRTVLPAESGFARPMKIVDYGPAQRQDSGWLPWSNCSMHYITDGAGTSMKPLVGIKAAFSVWGSKYGGSMMLGDYEYKNARPPLRNDPSDASCAILQLNKYTISIRPTLGQDGVWRKNGEAIDPDRTGLSGAFDIVSAKACSTNADEALNCSALAFHSHDEPTSYINRCWAGGLQLGELILLTNDVTLADYEAIDAYLNYKWFGRPYPAKFSQQRVRSLSVAEGATVTVEGGMPLVCSSLSGAGTVNGAITLTANAFFDVRVNDDGVITQTLTVSDGVDLSQGGTVRLMGNVENLKAGTYKLISAANIGSVANWTVTGYEGRKVLKLAAMSDGLYLNVTPRGFCVIVR